MTAHTPGPWKTRPADPLDARYLSSHAVSVDVGGDYEGCIALLVRGVTDASETLEANARLIAAAPELLEAANVALACMELEMNALHGSTAWKHPADALRAAIAKAANG